jgi:transposase
MCLITEAGEVLHQRLHTQRERFAAVFAERPRARILSEASTESAWVAPCLEALGHEVIVADPNDAPLYAQRSRGVTTDRRAAAAVAHAWRLGASHPAHRTSARHRPVRALLTGREAWVRSRTRGRSVVRALRRQSGYRLRRGATASCLSRVAALERPAALQAELEPRLRALQSVNAQLTALEQQPETLAQDDEVVQRLRTAPGVGPRTALSLGATLDDGERCAQAPHGESSLGLVPREGRAGAQPQRGKSTQQGRGPMRAWWLGAAWRI